MGEGLVLGRPLLDLMMFSLCVSLSWVDLTFTRIYVFDFGIVQQSTRRRRRRVV